MTGSPLSSPPLFHIGPVPIAAQVLSTWAIMAVLAVGCALLARRLRVENPSRTQTAAEWFVELISQHIVDVMRVEPAPYLPLVGTIFAYVLCANLSSLVPGNEPPTAHLETDAALALIVFCSVIAYGIRARGLGGYLKSFADPGWAMLPLNVLENLTRVFSLMIRLFGNVMSGVFVLGIVLSLAGLFVPIPFMALDVLVGVIQAYIFAVLAMVFIGAAVGDDHGSASPQESP
ncbi:F0F1 ATP synthase subunit A [Pigmentiphaga soli]|uniref:ATP synthase subunit a n=1 Tax=Pigmentiphaga soli TaxID=1007095 RepID=A0ABP8HCK4_9BURK